MIGWVFFFSPSIGYALRYLAAMFGGGAGLADSGTWFIILSHWLLYLLAVLGSTKAGYALLRAVTGSSARGRVSVSTIIVYFGMFFIAVAFLVTDTFNPFLYFRF